MKEVIELKYYFEDDDREQECITISCKRGEEGISLVDFCEHMVEFAELIGYSPEKIGEYLS